MNEWLAQIWGVLGWVRIVTFYLSRIDVYVYI